MYRMKRSIARVLASCLILSTGVVPSAVADALSETFSNPPPSARPHTWYHLMNGNVTKAGITRDFEALAKLGIGGVQIFDAGCAIPAGNLKFNSSEWFDMFRHAAAEARRLGLEICIPNCSGWSSSGGPWNPPANAMKVLTFRETHVHGPVRFTEYLSRDTEDNGFYADIAVVAFPTPPAELAAYPQVKTILEDDGFTLSADELFLARGMSFRIDYPIVHIDYLPMTVSVSQDGKTFTRLEEYKEMLAQHGICDRSLRYHAFPSPVSARSIRVRFGKAKVKCKAMEARPEAKLALSNLKSKTFAFRDEFPLQRDSAVAECGQVVPLGSVLDLTEKMSADGRMEWDVPSGDWTILRIGCKCNGRCNHPASEQGKGLEVDKLSAAALDYHIDQYVAKLCQHLGALAGNVSSGFNNVLVDSYEVGSQNWTQGFEKTFENRMGYSLLRYLPAFAGRIVGSVDETERFLEDFRRVVADEFADNYGKALARKCHSLGLKLSLEPYGNCPADNLQYGEFADIPMGELWSHANEGNFSIDDGNARVSAYVAHVCGRRVAATESFTAAADPYGSGRWLTTPFSLKAQCDRIYTRGVNRIIYHRFAHQPWADDRYLPGMTMGLYGMHFDRTQTWWGFADGWIRYQTRCQSMLQTGEYVTDALFYCGGEAPNQGGNPGGHRQFGDNPNLMMPPGYSWDVCPKSAFMRLRVDGGRVIAPGGLSYPLLALPPQETMGLEELEQISRLLAAGAKICGRVMPSRAPGLAGYPAEDGRVAARAKEVWEQGVMALSPVEALTKLGVGPDFMASGQTLDGDGGLTFTHRRNSSADWYFVAMPNPDAISFDASFRIQGCIPEIWDAERGAISLARDWREENGRTIVRLDLPISGSAFVVFRNKTPDGIPLERKYDLSHAVSVEGIWNVSFPNGFRPNALAAGADETVEFPVLSDWKDSDHESIRYFSGSATYRKDVVLDGLSDKFLATGVLGRVVLDLGIVREVVRVTINGKKFPALWKPPFIIDVTDLLRSGEKTLHLEIEVANLWANRLIGDDRTCADDCEWNEWGGIRRIPDWVKNGERSPTGRMTFTTWKHWKKEDSLLSSGLLGPVTLRFEAERLLPNMVEYPRPFSTDVSPNAKPWEKTAAQEFRDYFDRVALNGKVTVAGRDGVVFHIGDTAFAIGKGLGSQSLQNEEWVVKSFGRDVVLNGGGTRGCLYAVYRFLEDFGDIHWWMDGDEDVPPARPLALPALNHRGKPHFFYRDVYRSKKDDFRTAVRNRLNGNGDSRISSAFGGGEVFGPPYHCHTWRFHIPWERFGKEHPEWFALIDGKRTGGKKAQLCLTNPELPAAMAARIEEQIAKGEAEAKAQGLPPPRLYDMSMNDTRHGYCQCAACRASREKYGISGDQLLFENKVAAMLKERHPNLLFSVFAYYESEAVPKNGVKAADNIVVKLCNTRQNMAAGIFEADNRFMHDQVKAWRNCAKNLFVWEYAITFDKSTHSFPFASEFHIGEKIRFYAENGVIGLLVEQERPEENDFYELKYHLFARSLEDPWMDSEKCLIDFMRRYYGAAAGALLQMRRHLDNARRRRNGFVTWGPKPAEFSFLDVGDFNAMERLWNEAERNVGSDAKRLGRVRRARRGFESAKAAFTASCIQMRDTESGVSGKPFYDFTAADGRFWRHSDKIRYEDDNDALGGKTVVVDYDLSAYMKLPFSMGVYEPSTHRTICSRSWEKPLGEGYQWYSLERLTFPQRASYVFLTRSWQIQVAPWTQELSGRTCTIKAHVKFTDRDVRIDRVAIIPE